MNALPRTAATRLEKLCGLFGSDQVGEVAAAAWAADRLLKNEGLSWADVFNPRDKNADFDDQPKRRTVFPSAGEILARHGKDITEWERQFLVTIIRRPLMSPRQREIFLGIQGRFSK